MAKNKVVCEGEKCSIALYSSPEKMNKKGKLAFQREANNEE